MGQVRFVNHSLTIGGKDVPCISWSCTLSNQGSMATLSAETTISMIEDSNIDIISLAAQPNGAPVSLSAGYNGTQNLLFTGILDEIEGDEEKDGITLRCRDNAACLADGRQTLAGMSYRNQTIGQIVTQIANKFAFTPNVTDDGIMAGPLMNGENAFNPKAQTYWSLLQRMADDLGFECYVTPDNTLFFGPEKNQGLIQCAWNQTRASKPINPLLECKWRFNPRNNSNITVKVLSNTPGNAQIVLGQATAASRPIPAPKKDLGSMLGRSPAISSYGNPASSKKQVAKSVYYILDTGTDPELANAKAQALANDLAKRQVILSGEMEGLPALKIHSHLQITAGTSLDNYDFNVAEVTHSYSPEAGYRTSFRALALINNG